MNQTALAQQLAGVRRLGILGGCFDPIHEAHLNLARKALSEFALDAVLILPLGDAPHKRVYAGQEERYHMVELACHGEKGLFPSRFEIDRGGRTYTVDTLRALRSELGGEIEFYYIIGGDTLLELPNWREAEAVVKLTKFLSFERAGMDVSDHKRHLEEVLCEIAPTVFFSEEPGRRMSSTQIRRRVTQELPITGMVPERVEEYIGKKGLYRDCGMDFESAREKLRTMLKPKRFLHTSLVVSTADSLSREYGVNRMEARWAALLHDCAKDFGKDEQVALCGSLGIALDDVMLLAPELIHGPLGAEIAKSEFGMEDEAVLEAIRYHTLASPGMTALDKVVHLADAIEPGRSYDGVEALRALAYQDLDRALVLAIESTIQYLFKKGGFLHPRGIEARNELLVKIQQSKPKEEKH